MPSFFLLHHPVCSVCFYSQVKRSFLPLLLNSFCVSFSIVYQMLFDYFLSFSHINHLLICDRVLQNLWFVFCFVLGCEHVKISQTTWRGHTVSVMNDGATIWKSLHINNLAPKLLVGWLFLNIIIFVYCSWKHCLGNITWFSFHAWNMIGNHEKT